MIKIKGLTKKFGPLKVLDSIDLELEGSGIVAILGPNGSGKTTLIKSLLGMVVPDRGEIDLEGQSILGKWEYRNHLNYLPQIAQFPSNVSVAELIAMIKDLRPLEANEQALIDRLKLQPHLNKKLGNLSGGTRQKVNLLLAFMFDASLMVLDEPTTGLDPGALLELKEMIREERSKGKLILLTSHIMGFVEEIADEMIFLLDGKIHYRGNLQTLKTQTQTETLESAIASLVKP